MRLQCVRIFSLYAEEPLTFSRQLLCISRGVLEPAIEQLVKPFQLCKANGSLHVGHSVVEAGDDVSVGGIKPAVSPVLSIAEFTAEHPALACGKPFISVETVSGEMAPYWNHAQGFTGVLYYRDAKLAEITRILSVEMDW